MPVDRGGHPRLSRIARELAQVDRRLPDRTGSDGAVPVVLCIDCEPDPRVIDPLDPPAFEGYELAQDFFATWRDLAAARTGAPVHLNWFFRMDPQIAMSYGDPAAFVDHSPSFVAHVRDAGDGLGIHPHAWRWDLGRETWVSDLADAPYVRECLKIALDSFRSRFGHPPELLRFGDGFLSEDLVNAADRAGIGYDLTIEPGRAARPIPETHDGEIATAWPPDWQRVPRHPYHPEPGVYRRPASGGGRAICMMPLSSGPRWLGSSVRARAAALRAHGGAGWKQRDLLYMALPHWTGADGFGEVLRRTLAAQRRLYLAFAIRTDWARRPDQRRNIERCLGALLEEQARRRLVFCTPAEAYTILADGALPAARPRVSPGV